MVKPVNVNEMVLRVGALLRRAQILNEHKIVIGSTEFDYDAIDVYKRQAITFEISSSFSSGVHTLLKT